MSSSKSRSAARWLVFLCCFMGSTLLFAQSTGGRILGRVADPTGAVLSGVKVTLTNEATDISRDVQTNSSGDYVLVEVPPGVYDVQFEHKGFKKNLQKGVTVDVNQIVTVNTTMQLGAAQEVVEVTSEAPLVDITSTQLGAVVNDRSVTQLPRSPGPERITTSTAALTAFHLTIVPWGAVVSHTYPMVRERTAARNRGQVT